MVTHMLGSLRKEESWVLCVFPSPSPARPSARPHLQVHQATGEPGPALLPPQLPGLSPAPGKTSPGCMSSCLPTRSQGQNSGSNLLGAPGGPQPYPAGEAVHPTVPLRNVILTLM